MTKSGITVECVHCKARRLLDFEEAAALTDVPICGKCGMPMVAVKAMASVAIRRIVDEIRDETTTPVSRYDRVYSRHNR